MSGHGDAQPDGDDQHLTEVDVDHGRAPFLDETVGPHSPASDDVSLSASDVTTPGVLAAREDIEARERAAEASPAPTRRGNPHHPTDDPDSAQAADVRRD